MPGWKQAWPMAAACWSPAMPAIGIAAPSRAGSVVPYPVEQSRISGSSARGTRKASSISSHQSPVRRLQSRVRLALVASVACTRPPVRRQSRKLSIVPKASSPRSAAPRAPSTVSRIQPILVAEKYGSSSRPVRSRTCGSRPAARSPAQASAVRRSCQTIARCTGRPVARSQSTVVSRWLAMPMAAIPPASIPARAMASRAVARVLCQISSGSCSTQPERGKCWGNSSCATAAIRASESKRMAREEVVP